MYYISKPNLFFIFWYGSYQSRLPYSAAKAVDFSPIIFSFGFRSRFAAEIFFGSPYMYNVSFAHFHAFSAAYTKRIIKLGVVVYHLYSVFGADHLAPAAAYTAVIAGSYRVLRII